MEHAVNDPFESEEEINRRHNEKMARRKAARERMLATKTEERGLLIVHTGKGKGKSTAAFGLVLRCLGHGMRVGIVQFVKGVWSTGERVALERFGDLVTCRAMGEGFTWDTQDRARDIAAARNAWETAKAMIADPSYRLVLLDELNIVLRYDYLPLAEVVATLQTKPRDLHIVVTGRNARPELVEAADLVTEMTLVKHPFRSGVKAQRRDRVLMALALMLQGTGSDVGKSVLLAGLARAFTRRGLKVRPFKPQNMSNNAAVTADGGEIGRAQALQARACGVLPVTDMNPVLLKPQSETGAQIVLKGRVWGAASAGEYRRLAPGLLPELLGSFARLAEAADLVLVEGAGSPAEINLRDGDIANMGFAEAADVPVVLVGDIERGGVIAQLVGTVELLSATERALLAGYIVNKFRGDIRLFDGGISALRERTGLPSFGVVPFFPAAANLPAEDSLALAPDPRSRHARREGGGEGQPLIRIVVPVLPHIANFDDLDPLRAEPGVELLMVRPGHPLPRDATLVILPGSKATIADLEFLRSEGWDIDLQAHRRQGGRILGLCGGYQMLGQTITDRFGMEGRKETVRGLGLLEVDTVLDGAKRLAETDGYRACDPHAGQRLRDASRHDDRAGTRTSDAAPGRRLRRLREPRWPRRRMLSAWALHQRSVPPSISRGARRRYRRHLL